jgi:preprotein translocase subunit YajC
MNLTVLTSLLAMAPTPQPGTQPNPTGQLIQMLGTFALFGVVLYFLMIRPQQVKTKQHTELLKALKPGDKIVTSSGIIGVVVSVKEKTVSIRSADTKLEVLKSAVTDVTERSSGGNES